MSSYKDILNEPSCWFTAMPRPSGCGEIYVAYWQSQIDSITGTTSGRPRLQLRWAPEVMRWRPSPVGEGAYNFPDWTCGFSHGQPIAVPRWVLMERMEPEQFAPGWEFHRRQRLDGIWYDLRGPLPKEYYTKCFMHAVHEDGCCLKAEVARGGACYGRYVEPNNELLNWVRERWRLILTDSDVQPFTDARHLVTPNAQREVKNQIQQAREYSRQRADEIFEDAVSHLDRRPTSGVIHAG